jgi:cell wall-associated NlpC family hydrolase
VKAAAVGLAAPACLLVLLIPVLAGGNQSGANATVTPVGGGAGFNPTTVPAQYLAAVEAAGSTCSQESPALIAAQIEQESGWNPLAVSPTGAEGIAQFEPGTWATWGSGAPSPFDAQAAIAAQGRYMCSLFASVTAGLAGGQLHGSPQDLALAAYNAGLGAVLNAHGVPALPATTAYVAAIDSSEANYEAALSASAFGQRVLAVLQGTLGAPYVFGGGTPTGPSGSPTAGFDCSGLTLYAVYQATGGQVLLPHLTDAQMQSSALTPVASGAAGSPVPFAQLEIGDLIFFAVPTDPDPWGHVGIYVGAGQMIDAPHTGAVVRQEPVWATYGWAVYRVNQA